MNVVVICSLLAITLCTTTCPVTSAAIREDPAPSPTNDTAGTSNPCCCKERSFQFLCDLFFTVNNPRCFNVERLSTGWGAFRDDSSQQNASAGFNIVSGYTQCLVGLNHSSECFHKQSRCTWAEEVQRTGHGMFPSFDLHTTCSGCSRGDSACLERSAGPGGPRCYYQENSLQYIPLVREEGCGQDGYEVWSVGHDRQRHLTVACSCINTS